MNTSCLISVVSTACALDVVCPTAVDAIMQVPKMTRIQTAAMSPLSYPLHRCRLKRSLCFPAVFCIQSTPLTLKS